jgi:hypothetical protein
MANVTQILAEHAPLAQSLATEHSFPVAHAEHDAPPIYYGHTSKCRCDREYVMDMIVKMMMWDHVTTINIGFITISNTITTMCCYTFICCNGITIT